ncbi:hypothetical protein VB735_04605 [Halotia wernerae UHCC 0503]|nr:hypothetical protein [Halotia wernerae UHCC 0503]
MTQNIFVQTLLDRMSLLGGSPTELAKDGINFVHSNYGLEQQGILNTGVVYWGKKLSSIRQKSG